MARRIPFALNHMVAPRRSVEELFDLARKLDVSSVEIRNDLAGRAIADGTPASAVKAAAAARGLAIISINALQRFNDWGEARAREAEELASYAEACGVRALVLCPVNDRAWKQGLDDAARMRHLREALTGLAPILARHQLVGLLEPLGFEECSLRSKREAAEAIAQVGAAGRFKLVHDTFHHRLAGEDDVFPELTGLVHVSGVEDRATPIGELRDRHRVLVGAGDLLGNVAQLKALFARGYQGPVSFEPFAESVASLADPSEPLRQSMDYLQAETA